jgi:hypothetical protein
MHVWLMLLPNDLSFTSKLKPPFGTLCSGGERLICVKPASGRYLLYSRQELECVYTAKL